MKIEQGEKIQLKATILIEVSSAEYEDTESIIDEFSQETDYEFRSTDTVDVHDTKIIDVELTQINKYGYNRIKQTYS